MSVNRNVATIVTLESLWGLGAAFVTFDIISALIYRLGGGAMLVALASTASGVLLYAPQVLVPYFKQRIVHPVRGAALGQAIIVAMYVLVAIGLGLTTSSRILLTLVVLAVALSSLGNALNYPYYQQLRLRMFPPKARSKSYSTALFFSNSAGAAGAALCIVLLTAAGGPAHRNYFWCFALGSSLLVASTICYGMLRDSHPTEPAARELRPLSAFLREYVEIVRRDRNLRVYLLSECMNWMSSMGSTFMAYYAVSVFGQGIAPECSFWRTLAGIATVPIGHYVVSRFGSRAAIIVFYLCAIAALILFVVPAHKVCVLAAFFLLGSAVIFRVNYLFHFIAALCPDDDKTKYYAVCNVVVSPVILAGPFLGGVFLKVIPNYQVLFALSAVPLVIGFWVAARILRDPGAAVSEDGAVPRVTIKRMTNYND